MSLSPRHAKTLWHLWHGGRRLGISGALGLSLLGSALACHYLWTVPLAEALAAQEQHDGRTLVRLRAAASGDERSTRGHDLGITLGREHDFPATLHQLLAAAADAGLVIEQGEYKASAQSGEQLVRYGLSLPATGHYPALRHFLAQAEAIPGMRLESLLVSRARIEDGQVSARFQFALLLEKD